MVERVSASKPTKTRHGKATYRFVRDGNWRVSSRSIRCPRSAQAGAVGADFNADHLAVAETDRHGNLIAHQRTSTPRMNSDQRHAAMGDAVKWVVSAPRIPLPIVIERLDFRREADWARTRGVPRMLSGCSAETSTRCCVRRRAGIDRIA